MGSSRIARIWRKIVIAAAQRVQLNSPFMCVFFAALFILIMATSRNLWVSFGHIVFFKAFHSLLRDVYYLNRLVQVLCVWLAFIFFCRMLQICYPKYYEHKYDQLR